MQLTRRPIDPKAHDALLRGGIDPLLARLYAARGVQNPADLQNQLANLLPPASLLNIEKAAALLDETISAGQRMVIVADYDCDGATACAVGIRGLRMFGADIDYVVPNRFEYGYGLTPEIVRLTVERFAPRLIITVDNGIASVEGAREAEKLGVGVLVTDHHLAGSELPEVACIVNPNQPGCGFASKNLAGVGVMFYVLLALRARRRDRNAYAHAPQPRLDTLLGLVALGTVADVVRLDTNNRCLVAQGLQRIREGRTQVGVTALFLAAGREARTAGAHDLGFAVGPRINAAGRLADMSLGIECLLTDDLDRALEIANQLDAINRERRSIESSMQDSALAALASLEALADASEATPGSTPRASLCLFDPTWHQGVVGVLAARLKERFHRPTVAFAPVQDGLLRGSGRSITGLHLRDVLDLVSKREPGLIQRFGGHAMAAGLTIAAEQFALFSEAFEAAVQATLDPALLHRTLETDGPLADSEASPGTARVLATQVWGQGFPAPLFCNEFVVENQRVVKGKHLKLELRSDAGRMFDAIWFNRAEGLAPRARVVYRLSEDSYRGASRLQLVIETAEAV